jgi:lipopolysaccharide transport system permease protein
LPKDLVFLAMYNPIGYIIDSFNYMFVGTGSFDWVHIAYSGGFSIIILFFGLLIFNQVEKNFMDTV